MDSQTGVGLAGSSYLRDLDCNQTYDQNNDENWNDSDVSEPIDYSECEERNEFMFENKARFKGQWKGNYRHGYGV